MKFKTSQLFMTCAKCVRLHFVLLRRKQNPAHFASTNEKFHAFEVLFAFQKKMHRFRKQFLVSGLSLLRLTINPTHPPFLLVCK